MTPIALYCKSYRGDIERVKILLATVKQHNVDHIPFYISVPDSDLEIFRSELGTDGYTLICDEDIYQINGTVRGWLNQQIIKSSFWKLGLCENYVCIDSDSYFIRPFRISDFLYNGSPYTVMHEQHELFSWTCNKSGVLGFDPQISFGKDRREIMELFNRESGRLYDFGPSPVIWSCKVWKSFEEHFLTPSGATIVDALNKVPSEFSWYGEWLLAYKPIDILPIEPLFKVFHYKGQYDEYQQQDVQIGDLSKVYLGVVMQSNAGLPVLY